LKTCSTKKNYNSFRVQKDHGSKYCCCCCFSTLNKIQNCIVMFSIDYSNLSSIIERTLLNGNDKTKREVFQWCDGGQKSGIYSDVIPR
jgi:hypothetical protein